MDDGSAAQSTSGGRGAQFHARPEHSYSSSNQQSRNYVDFRIEHVKKINNTMPSASPSQYICSLIEEMDQSSLQPPFMVDEHVHMEAPNDCRRGGYTQNALDIEEILCDYNSESEIGRQGNCYQNSTGSHPNFHSWNYSQLPQRSINVQTCAPNTTATIAHASYGTCGYGSVQEASKQDTSCCTNYQNKSLDFERTHGSTSNICAQYDQRMQGRDSKAHEKSEQAWHTKMAETWTPKQVLDWIFDVAEKHQLDCGLLHAENFRGISGADLCKMGMDDFLQMEPNFGGLFYELFRKVWDGMNFKPRMDTHTPMTEDVEDSCSSPISLSSSPPHYQVDNVSRNFDSSLDYQSCNDPAKTERQENMFYDPHQHQQQQPYPCARLPFPHHMQARHSFPGATPPVCNIGERQCMYQQYCGTPPGINQCTIPCELTSPPIPRRRPGRPRIKSLPTEEEAHREKKAKNQHLWEFIYEVLMNPLYNPQYVRWENQREGIFRFVQSEAVAQLWGSLKNNENMTYEKLSRAMRHYYKRGILERVEGRRLVYKFTSLAMERVREKRFSV